MKILSIDYKGEDMSFKDLNLGQLNLFVSRNGVGKSRLLRKVFNILNCFLYQVPMSGKYDFGIVFLNHKDEYSHYEIISDIDEGKFSYYEALEINSNSIFTRNFDEPVFMYNSLTEQMDEHNIPFDKLAMSIIRDTKKYPLIEEFLNDRIDFNQLQVGLVTAVNIYNKELFNEAWKNINIAEAYHDLPAADKNKAKDALISIGYNIAEMYAVKVQNEYELHVREADLKNALQINQLSQGMLRAVHLVIDILHYNSTRANMLYLIDDITEGLDYARAKKLGKWVFDTCQERGAQLIATTNDSFLMKVIDIEHWNILNRKGDEIQCLNYENSKEVFDEFAFTGLSNFDLFSSNFLDKHNVWKK
jgi:AAA domain, putative AbiEii toxin, Type IV TA system